MLTLIAAFGLALVAAWLLTPVVRDAAHGAGLLDEPEARKVHQVPIPRLGGVAIGAALYLGMAAALVVARATGAPLNLETGHLPGILVGAALIAGVGLLDDLQGMRARVKLAAQVVVALVAFGMGLSIDRLSGPWGTVELGPWALPLTVVWVVALINAVNLIDGIDGLASGVALTALAAFFAIGLIHGGTSPVMPVVAAAAGGVIGFLRYNLYPASIIMGDTGSMLIGFVLAALGISLTQAAGGGVPPWVPVIAVGVALADMAWAILRRIAAGAPVLAPDKRHIHHQLMAGGLSQRGTMLALTAVSAVLGGVAVLLALAAS
ncbi:MAG TPA: MraY family glycosyltransferase [candidate division Zixibacteria bacterium]|nr:MraY family glycosyltransferase [candidate division Zixibacteria bacterium]